MLSKKDRLMTHIAIQPEPPCERFQCEHEESCGAKGKACSSFSLYVRKGIVTRPTTPTQNKFRVVFRVNVKY